MLYEKENGQEYKEEVDSVDDEGDSVVIRQEISKEKRKFIFRWMEIYIIIMVFIVCALVRRSLERDENGQEEKQKNLLTQVEELEDRYGINIMWGGRSNNQHVNELMSAPNMTNDEEKIKATLDGIESIFQKYPDGFFDELKEDKVSNMKNDFIDVYLCDSIISSNDVADVADVVTGGSSGFYYKCSGAYILLDVNQEKNFSHIISHEIFHIMDSQIGIVSFFNEGINNELGDSIDFRWIKCNPDGYEYLKFGNNQDEIHVFDSDLPYDINTENMHNYQIKRTEPRHFPTLLPVMMQMIYLNHTTARM